MSLSGTTSEELTPWQVLRTRSVLDCAPWFHVVADDVRLPSGEIIEGFYRIETMDFVMIFPLGKDNQALTLRGYKHGPGKIMSQLPAGYMDRENESSLACAQRELLEETGHVAEEWRALGSLSVSGNRGMGRAHFFLAQGLCAVAPPDSGDLETLVIQWLSLDQLRGQWRDGEFDNAAAVALIGLALDALAEGV